MNEAHPHPIDLPHTSRLYKTLLQGGHFNRATNIVERVPGWDAGLFAEQFVEVVGKDVAVAMCAKGQGNGAFVIVELCGALMSDGREAGRSTVQGWFGPVEVAQMEESTAKGKKLLLEKINML